MATIKKKIPTVYCRLTSLLAVMKRTVMHDRNLHVGFIIFTLLYTGALVQLTKAILSVENYQANFQRLY